MTTTRRLAIALYVATAASAASGAGPVYFDVARGSHPHDVAAAPRRAVRSITRRRQRASSASSTPQTGKFEEVALGAGSAPHGVIVGPDGAPWITDGGQNAIVRVDPATRQVRRLSVAGGRGLCQSQHADFRCQGPRVVYRPEWDLRQLVPATGEIKVWHAPRGSGPYGIATTPSGDVYYASLAGTTSRASTPPSAEASVIEPPTPTQGARRVWSDSRGRIWVSYWNTGQVGSTTRTRILARMEVARRARARIPSGSTTATASG